MSLLKGCVICIVMFLFFSNILTAQEQIDIRLAVQLKMVKAHELYIQEDKAAATKLVNESILTILNEVRNGNIQPWMREAVQIAMEMTNRTEEEIALTMKDIDLQISIKKTVDVMNKTTGYQEPISKSQLPSYFSSLERSKATMDLARSRNRAAMAGHFLGQRHGGVGYRPIISFFPQGDMMMAGPVIVSPDRRYVRVGISAAQSGITAVHTFNFSTGKYQQIGGKR